MVSKGEIWRVGISAVSKKLCVVDYIEYSVRCIQYALVDELNILCAVKMFSVVMIMYYRVLTLQDL